MRRPTLPELVAAALGLTTLLGAVATASMYRRATSAEERARAAEAQATSAHRDVANETRGRFSAQAMVRARTSGEGSFALGPALRSFRLAERDGVPPSGGVRYALHLALQDLLRSVPLEGHRAPLTTFDLSPDGRRAVTAAEDGTARLWDLSTGRSLATLGGHTGAVSVARYVLDGARVVTTDARGRTRLWDAATGAAVDAPTPTIPAEVTPVGPWSSLAPTAVRVSRAGGAAVVLAGGAATLWDADGRAPRATLTGHADPITDIDLSPDGTLCLTTSLDGTARLWDVASGAFVRALEGHRAEVLRGRFTPDGRAVVTLGADRAARVWPLGGTALGYTLRSPAGGALRAVRFSRDGARVLTVGDPCLVWETETGRLLATLATGARTDDADFSNDGSRVVAHGPGGALVLRADGSGEVTRVPDATRSAALSHDARRLLVTTADGAVRLHDAADGRLLAALGGTSGTLVEAALLGETGLVLVARTVGDPGLWRTSDGGLERTLEGHGGPVRAVASTPDGRYIATASELGARLWNAASGLRFGVIDEHPGGVTRARFSRDGSHVATVGADGSARLWVVESVERVALLQNPEQPITDVLLADDGRRAATLTRWGMAQLWGHPRRQLGRPLSGHRRRIDAVRLSPDGRVVVTVSPDHSARLYDAASGDVYTALPGHARAVTDARFSPDGRRVATVSDDGTVRVWSVDEGEWLRLACALLTTQRSWQFDRPLREFCAAHEGPAGLRPGGG